MKNFAKMKNDSDKLKDAQSQTVDAKINRGDNIVGGSGDIIVTKNNYGATTLLGVLAAIVSGIIGVLQINSHPEPTRDLAKELPAMQRWLNQMELGDKEGMAFKLVDINSELQNVTALLATKEDKLAEKAFVKVAELKSSYLKLMETRNDCRNKMIGLQTLKNEADNFNAAALAPKSYSQGLAFQKAAETKYKTAEFTDAVSLLDSAATSYRLSIERSVDFRFESQKVYAIIKLDYTTRTIGEQTQQAKEQAVGRITTLFNEEHGEQIGKPTSDDWYHHIEVDKVIPRKDGTTFELVMPLKGEYLAKLLNGLK